MASHFGQKLLHKIGVDLDLPGSTTTTPTSQHNSPPERAVIDHEHERILGERGTYPRLARLSDGSILAAMTRRENGLRVLSISKSIDNAGSFSAFAEVTRGPGDVDNLFLLEIRPGHVLAAFRNHDLDPHGRPTYFRITVCQSTDGGRSWMFLSQAAEKRAPLGLWEPFMRLGRGGEVQMTFSQEFAPDDQRTMLVVSRDQGRSWSAPVCVEGAQERLRDGMTGIAVTRDASSGREALVMVFETTRYRTFNVEAVVSYDDGATWQHRHEVYVPPRGHNAGAPQIASFADGSLAAVFMTDEDADRVEWVKHAAIKVVFAGPPQDGRIRWGAPLVVCEKASVWPGVMALDDDTVMVTYDCRGPRAKTITWRRHRHDL
ncbi:hypothetical protein ASPZODRAFT_130189 [Penicilliopsis zonata CBS 506.65]|uniref:Sialidase domain-containing protein n=1 Tax=Penicilliopsis zonata CBS 506.65 TaxID=1073090 RepID=A0A1L9SLR9_9EURO|nr:hypothetical protein ASPZODRAFT_130189 [Penicilliopsis zonata CBS 506.65]OJJ48232.1 hypothetical protein ASPZODRAFT_130189 [Penicilliopsis zonata CBS 506.65]